MASPGVPGGPGAPDAPDVPNQPDAPGAPDAPGGGGKQVPAQEGDNPPPIGQPPGNFHPQDAPDYSKPPEEQPQMTPVEGEPGHYKTPSGHEYRYENGKWYADTDGWP